MCCVIKMGSIVAELMVSVTCLRNWQKSKVFDCIL